MVSAAKRKIRKVTMNQIPSSPSEPEKASAHHAASSSRASVRPMSGFPDGSGRDPIGEQLPPLPPKWSEMHNRSPIRAFDAPADEDSKLISRASLDEEVQRIAAQHCESHINVHQVRGGEPVSVTRCMACGMIDWEDLRRQADAYARRYAARLLEETYGYFEYPDGSRRMNWYEGKPNMINIQQVYNLFTMEPGQNGCAPTSETHTEATLSKVRRALLGSGLSEQTVTVAINEMQNEGILFREFGRIGLGVENE